MGSSYQDILRRLVVEDRRFVAELFSGEQATIDTCGLDVRSRSIARVAALVAHGGSVQTFRWIIGDALEADVTPDEIIALVLAIAPVVGVATIVDVAPKVALALDYDVGAALESMGP